MTKILAFIAAHMGYLWTGARFRIAGSEVTTENGGNAFLLVESDDLRLRFVCDRKQLLLDFQPVNNLDDAEWYSVDLIRRLYLGEREPSGLLDVSYAKFIGDHLDDIEERFMDASWSTTEAALKKLKVKRAQELFG
jgi:hypothetical protein